MSRRRAGLALLFVCALVPSAASAMGFGWGCSASQPPAVTVQLDAATALVGGTVNLAATATSQGANVQSFVAVVAAGQGTLAGGTTLGDGSTQLSFATGATSETGSASWVLPATPGTYTVTVTATNCASGSGSATATVTVNAQPVVLPVIDSLTASASSVLAGKSVTLTASAHDPAGGPVTYSWTAPAGTFSSVSTSSTTWTAPTASGQYAVTVAVSNGQGTANSSLPITVAVAQYQASSVSAFRAPIRIAVGPTGAYYVVDAKTGGIFWMTPSGQLVGRLKVPDRILAVTSGGDVLYATSVTGGLYAIDPSGGAPRAIPLAGGALSWPRGIARDAARGILWIAEAGSNQVRGVRLDGTTILRLTSAGTVALTGVNDVALDGGASILWVSVTSNEQGNNAFAFDAGTGKYLYSTGPYGTGDGQVTRTGGIAADSSGRLFVSDIFQGDVQVYQRGGSAAGKISQFGNGPGQLRLPTGIAVAPDGGVLVASMDQGSVKRFGTGNPPPPQTCTVNGFLDSDCDGMPDWWELKYGLNPYWAGDALLDADGDGLTNLQEYKLGTNPSVSDNPYLTTGDPSAQKPALTVPAPKTSDPGLVRFSATLQGPSGCTVSWKQRLGPQVALRGADSLTPSFVARAPGRYQFQGAAICGSVTTPASVLEATIREVAPRADAGRLVVSHAGSRTVLDGRFSSDANGDPLTYAWDQAAGAPLSGAVTGPTLALKLHEPGYFAFDLTAADPSAKSGTAEAPVLVVGSEGALTAAASSPVVGAVGTAVTLDASQSVDPIGTASYSWTQVAGPPVSLSGAGSSRAIFTPARPGHYAFEVILAAGRLRSPPARADVYVGEEGAGQGTDEPGLGGATGGALPTAAVAQAALIATVGEPLSLDGSLSAPAGGSGLQYAWRQVSGPAAGLTEADRAVATVVPFAPGAYVFELSVAENGTPGLPVRVSVLATSPVAGEGVPAAVAMGPATGTTGTSLSLDGTGSSDPDGHWLRYRWTQVAGPWVALDDPSSATPSFVPRQPGTYVFELEVDDQKIRSAPAMVTLSVSDQGGSR